MDDGRWMLDLQSVFCHWHSVATCQALSSELSSKKSQLAEDLKEKKGIEAGEPAWELETSSMIIIS